MPIIYTTDYEAMSAKAARLLAACIKENPSCVLGLATGSTPEGTYRLLVEQHRRGELDFSQVRSVNLDEYAGLSGDNHQSYRCFMDKHLFNHVNIVKENTHVPDGKAADLAAECAAYDRLIKQLGGVDLQVLGIGLNGHIGFNEPADVFTADTHVAELDDSTIRANARFFSSIDEVPTKALTVGMRTILQAKQVLLLAGQEKQDIIERALHGPITPQVPASLLQLHPHLTVIVAEN